MAQSIEGQPITSVLEPNGKLTLTEWCAKLSSLSWLKKQPPEAQVKILQALLTQLDQTEVLALQNFDEAWPESYQRLQPLYKSKQLVAFVIKISAGTEIMPHNHPKMVGVIRVLEGEVKVTTFKTPKHSNVAFLERDLEVDLQAGDTASLTPTRGNFHRILAVQNSYLLDILTPQYSLLRLPTFYRVTMQGDGAFVGVLKVDDRTKMVKAILKYALGKLLHKE